MRIDRWRAFGALLAPPESVELRVEGSTLVAEGSASREWIDNAHLLYKTIPAIHQFRDDDLVEADRHERLLRSAILALRPPSTVRVTLQNRELVLSGVASKQWVDDSKRFVELVPGISRVRDDGLDVFETQERDRLIEFVTKQTIYFSQNSSEIQPEQVDTITRLANSVRTICDLSDTLDDNKTIVVMGHSDETGSEKANTRLGMARADAVMRALMLRGVKAECLMPVSRGAAKPGPLKRTLPDRSNRVTTFRVDSREPVAE